MTCVDAIREVFREDPRVHTAAEVVAKTGARYPEGRWVPGTISAALSGLCVNHGTAHHYQSFRRHAFLFTPGCCQFQPLDGAVERQVAVAEEARPARRSGASSSPMGDQSEARPAAAQQDATMPIVPSASGTGSVSITREWSGRG